MPSSPLRSPGTAPDRVRRPALPYEESDLDRYRDLQQLAYGVAERAAGRLRAGMRESDAAERLRQELRAAGIGAFARRPSARFGRRTAGAGTPGGLPGMGGRLLARLREPERLRDGTPYLLDCVLTAGGRTVGVALAGRLGGNPVWDVLRADLPAYRDLVLREVRRGSPLHRLGRAVDALAARHGYDNPDRGLLGGVIARSAPARAGDPQRRTGPARPASHAHRLPPGLWAVSPRVAFRGVGVAFEELLVVTETSACWLDDDLPHARTP
ncbi:M24 family metallopeptidase [Kitasatospora sp. NPDC048365]|uniref:M24 family metallopeptidase n=1 Tax=Kitasatospora sp. NPDC048365 TaxID=3364050 RepID=UPI0037158809